MTLHYVIRTFPQLSESFVAREVEEVVRRGEMTAVWSLLPASAEMLATLPADVRGLVHSPPVGSARVRTFAASVLRALLRQPVGLARALAWCGWWALRERDVRHLGAIPFAAWLAERVEVDAHLHAHFANTPTTVALATAMIGGQTVSFTGHAKDLFAVTSPAFLAAKARRATMVAVESDYSVRRVQTMVAAQDAPKVVAIRNGLRPRSPRVKAEIATPPVILAVARLVPKKGLPTLIEAIALLRADGVEVVGEIIGDGPQQTALEAQITAAGLGDTVALLGAQPRDAVDAALARATIFCLPCRREDDGDEDNLPVAMLEAMQAGLPVVTTPIAGIPEAVIDGATGLLVAPDEPAELASALGALLSDPRRGEALGEAARARIGELFDLQRNVALMAQRRLGGRAGAPRSTPPVPPG